MTVKELKEKLEDLDEDKEIHYWDSEMGWGNDINNIFLEDQTYIIQ